MFVQAWGQALRCLRRVGRGTPHAPRPGILDTGMLSCFWETGRGSTAMAELVLGEGGTMTPTDLGLQVPGPRPPHLPCGPSGLQQVKVHWAPTLGDRARAYSIIP